ncbi:unnamed protein product, partial [Prorocentrum cordatum]
GEACGHSSAGRAGLPRPPEVGTGTVSRRALTDKEDQGLRGASRGSFSRPRTGDCREEKEDARIVGHLMHLRPLREMARDPRFAAGAQA